MFGEIGSLINNASASTLRADTSSQDYKQEFLQLLLTNLKHQDPSKPFDSTQMIAQQAQFASLEQMTNLNQNLISLMAMENVTQSSMLLGKTVSGISATDNSSITGVVTGLTFGDDGTPVLTVDFAGVPHQMTASNVKSIALTP